MGKPITTINVDLLILEVQKYPCLYDTEDASHRDAEKVYNIWEIGWGILGGIGFMVEI